MRVLLSTIGSRGDVQPLVALALQLRALGQEPRLCVPPDFRDWIEGLGVPVTPIGPELRSLTAASPSPSPSPPSLERRRQLAEATVAAQFETIAEAARGCDIIVGASALQIAAPSVAEKMGIPYVFAAYCPIVLPSPHHAPPPVPLPGLVPPPATADNRELWDRNAERVNETFGAALNAHRAVAGLAPVGDVRRHIFTERPWLAADSTLAPWPDASDDTVVQTGAWIMEDARELPSELQAFLDAGAPPVYFGFGSMRAPQDVSHAMTQAARAVGRRAVVSRGWAGLSLADDAPDGILIGEVNLLALFARVAAVVHHGGAGTTTLAAAAGAPQVIVPQLYDQFYWARRIDDLGAGTAHAPGTPSGETLARALERTLQSGVAARAQSLATAVSRDGTRLAARRLLG